MVARLLQLLTGESERSELDNQLQGQADRIATNRVAAGVHFPVDSMAGRALGELLAGFIRARAGAATNVSRCTFDTTGMGSHEDFDFTRPTSQATSSAGVQTIASGQLFTELWAAAVEEWK